ncbi:hypothetical protein CHLRE_08g372300v5 [Chlamydomonas reinhardtii]|uniref:EamA domain-containing protein n=1 Tax=Chlamydomonas reinhardtii TaxID=3055 RepID=A0A2K3DHB2_CHLRE|nr:uncharacterized protein CHLRE_08g372300v5 [Chlamydomonas reinhardtii]PNW79924.1 hypothetical protein CHLRE_08g372300v5 [Chlamydomonas reinhardtii]
MASSRCGPPSSLAIAPGSVVGCRPVGGLARCCGVQLPSSHRGRSASSARLTPLAALTQRWSLTGASTPKPANASAAATAVSAAATGSQRRLAPGASGRRPLLAPPAAAPGPGPSLLNRAAPEAATSPSSPSSPSASSSASPASAAGSAAAPPPPTTPALGGYLSLAFVPILWGTYNPAIRYLYAESDPLDPASLTAVRTIVSAGALLLPAAVGYLWTQGAAAWRRRSDDIAAAAAAAEAAEAVMGSDSGSTGTSSSSNGSSSSSSSSSGSSSHNGNSSNGAASGIDVHHAPMSTAMAVVTDGAADGVAAAAGATPAEDDPALTTASASASASAASAASATASASASTASSTAAPTTALAASSAAAATASTRASTGSSSAGLFAPPLHTARLGPVLTRTFNSVVLGGLELGLLNFMGTALQVEGLHSTSATRAGFLAEVTAVLVPAVSYLAGYDIPRQMWVAVGIGLVGSTLVAYDASLAGQQAKSDGSSSVSGSSGGSSSGGVVAVEPGAVAAAAPAAAAAPPALAVDGAVTSSSSDMVTATATATAAGDVAAEALAAATAAAPVAEVAADAAASAAVAAVASTAAVVNTAGSALPLADPAILADTAAAAAAAAAAATAATATATTASAAADIAAAAGDAALAVTEALASASAAAADAVATTADAAAASVAATTAATAAATAVVAGTPGATALEATGGELYLLLACLFYSVCTVRMGIYSPRHDTVSLAAMKKVGLSSMSLMWMASTNLQHGAALGSVFSFPDLSSRSPTSLAVLAYSGIGPGALATLLQVQGLSSVPATTAQVIYSFTPLATAFFAFWILGGEPTGPLSWAGGMLLIGAALMAASVQNAAHQQKLREHEEATAAAAVLLAAAQAEAEAAGAGSAMEAAGPEAGPLPASTTAAQRVESGVKQAVSATRK